MAKHQKAFILLLVASTISLATAKHHKEEHHPIFIDNPEPSKEAGLDLPIALIPSDDIQKKDDNILVKSEEVNIDKKLKPAELVFNKKYFDDNPLIPPSHDALVPKVVCEEGSKDCEKHKKKDKRSGRHRRHHKHRRSRRASGDKKDDKKVEDTDIDKPQSDAPYDLVAAESYASNPCLLPYTPRCGGPSYDIVNPFERRYNGNYYQLPRQSPSNYYLPVVPPVSIGRWVPDTSIRYFPINRVYWNPGYPYDNRPYLPPFRPTKRPNTIDRPGATEKPDIENRFPGQVEDYDDRPIWDYVVPRVPSPTKRPAPPLNHAQEIEQSKRPSAGSSPTNQVQQNEGRPNQRPSQSQRPSGGFSSSSSSSSSSGFGGQPQTAQQSASRIGRCVYAIINCCDPRSRDVHLECFERLDCPGPFWDRNPCSSELAIAALTAANSIIG